MSETFYLPMDCPNCGRRRLIVYPDERVMECERCGASGYECAEDEHEGGGPHQQTAFGFFRHSQREPVTPHESMKEE